MWLWGGQRSGRGPFCACRIAAGKKYKNKDILYHEFLVKIFNHDAEAGHFSKWILAYYGPKILSVTPKT